jgi:hypothetical protein
MANINLRVVKKAKNDGYLGLVGVACFYFIRFGVG